MESYKDKRSKENASDLWMVFENTHEAIIDPQTWETVQRLRKTIRRTDTMGEANPLTGLMFCADCGGKLYNKRSRGRGKREERNDYTYSTYALTNCTFSQRCTGHFIRTTTVREILLSAIRKINKYVRENEAELPISYCIRRRKSILTSIVSKANCRR